TSFPLTDVRIKNWKNFDGFFNNVLLRRPPRKFSHNMGGSIQALNVTWSEPGLATMLYEARIGSTLRYFTRDIGKPNADGTTPVNASGVTGAEDVATTPAAPPYDPRAMMRRGFAGYEEAIPQRIDTSHSHPDLDDWHFAGYHSTSDSGVAAWNDKGAASEAARAALTEAAGIEIPKAEFVMKVLGVYLLVLVPLNWLLFWLIGRVEWAWVAAPIIAIVGAGAVIRLAQLDIGFARNRTEIAVLEMQGGYERAHLTRYTALYTSLTSNYTAAFAEPTALALPFPGGPRKESLLSIANYTDVIFRRDKETSLSGLLVYSNETGMLHSEQMLTLGKNPKVTESLVLAGDEQKGYSIRNTTDITIRDVGIVRRVDPPGGNQPPRIETAYVAKLEPATSAPLRFSPLREDLVWLPEWNQSSSAFAPPAGEVERGRVRLTQLARLAAQRLRLLPGDVRLVGWTSDLLPGMELRPAAPQNSTYTLVLSHLVRGPLPPVRADSNVFEDYLDPTFDLEPATEGDMPETTP
ncbi:MAG TPA: hypothetical protein VFB80_24590, partial [Pirellulaceae bacterium]|nr:hypothetical protein [Pirellulaceae bacterium]